MADSRAILKAFFETGDIPTQAQFAALIDSLLSIEDNSNLKDNIKIKSITNGKIQINVLDTDIFFTSDGDAFGEWLLSIGDFGGNLVKFGLGGFVIDSLIDPPIGFRIISTTRMQVLVPTFANNAAAIIGGLLTGDMYKTATGELRVVTV